MDDDSSITPEVLVWDWDRADVSQASSSPSTDTIGDMRRLLSNPAHVNAIRHVTLRGVRAVQHHESASLGESLSEREKTTLKSWFADAKLPRDKSAALTQDPEIRLADATAIMLSRLPALRTIVIHTFDRSEYDNDGECVESRPSGDAFMTLLNQLIISARGDPAFQSVETAKILVPLLDGELGNEFDFYIYADTVLPLYYLPQIQSLELQRVEDHRKPISWPTPESPSATSLRNLVLGMCQLSEDNIGRLLRASPNVKTLHCEAAIDAEYAQAWFDLGKLRDSLFTLKDSLEDLSFALTLWTSTAIDCGGAGPWGIRGLLGPLEDFTRLTRLAISLPVLLGWQTTGSATLADVLPESIQSLAITNEMSFWWRYQWDDFDWDNHNQAVPRWQSLEAKILEYLESRPRNLKELRVEICTAGKEERAEDFKASLVSKGLALGVEVAVELVQ